MLRGSSLKNTDWVIGFIVYSGHQTKIMMNSANSKYKMSSIEKGTNRQIVLIFVVQLIMCFLCSITGTVWQKSFKDQGPSYLDYKVDNVSSNNVWILMIIRMTGTWVLIFT